MSPHSRGQSTLLLGTGELSGALESAIRARPRCGLSLIGIVADRALSIRSDSKLPLLGYMDALNDIIGRTRPKRIVVALTDQMGVNPARELVEARFYHNIQIDDGAAVYEQLCGKVAIDSQTQSAMLYSRDFQPSRLSLLIARGFSLFCAVAGALLFTPLFLLIAVAIKIESRGPILFVQERMGLACKSFRLLKFRTMHPEALRKSEWAGDNHHRITHVGKWLRKFRLDELPQLFNILSGDMNLIGPRPHPTSNYELFVLVSRNMPVCGSLIPYYSLRSTVRPGITGWAQVRYQYANNLGEEIEKLRFDLYYVKHYSIWLDLQILFETIKVVVCGQEAALPVTRPAVTANSKVTSC